MPMHIDNLTSRVHVSTGDLPFTDEQLARLVELVSAKLARDERDRRADDDATALRRQAAPPSPIGR